MTINARLDSRLQSPRPLADGVHMIYHLRVWAWDRRRRRLARHLEKRGAATYEVLAALRDDTLTHPHPRG